MIFAALVPLGPLWADDSATIKPGTWVRVSTGRDVIGEGFSIGSPDAIGNAISHDKRTATFDVHGRSVRVARPDKTIEGPVDVLNDKTLVLRDPEDDDGLPIAIPRQAIASLDVRRRQSWKTRGLLIGALAGGVAGGLLGRSQETVGDFHGLTTSLGIVGGTLSGALIGVLAAPGAKWTKNIPLDHVQVGLQPTRRGVGLSISVAF